MGGQGAHGGQGDVFGFFVEGEGQGDQGGQGDHGFVMVKSFFWVQPLMVYGEASGRALMVRLSGNNNCSC